MTPFDEMLLALRDARRIASPYARATDDPDTRRRDLADRFDGVIAKARLAQSTPNNEAGFMPASPISTPND